MAAPISILLADNQYLIRVGLRHILDPVEDFEVVSEATTEPELLHKVGKYTPKVLIMDYNQPDDFNTETVSKVTKISPTTNVLIISADETRSTIYETIEKGVNSFLTKHCDQGEIVEAIQATARGDRYFCKSVLNLILDKTFGKEEEIAATPLTPRELDIVRLIAKGLIAKEIAADLGLSTHTIYTHRKNIMKKLNLGSASELVLYALDKGIVRREDL